MHSSEPLLPPPSFLVSGENCRSEPSAGRRRIEVAIATNRTTDRLSDPERSFGSGLDEMRYGIATVSMSAGRRLGAFDRPDPLAGWYRPWRQALADKNRQIMLEPFGQRTSHDGMGMAGTAAFDVLLHVPGAAASWGNGVARAAQLACDTGFTGVAAVFSWPTRGAKHLYVATQTLAEASEPVLERYLEELARNPRVRRIVIIAHSRGGRLAVNAVHSLIKRSRPVGKITDLVLAVADVDPQLFATSQLPLLRVQRIAVTNYVHEHDWAMIASAKAHNRIPIGLGGPRAFVADGVETIDLSDLDRGTDDLLRHNVYASHPAALRDLELLLQGMRAETRTSTLRRDSLPGGKIVYRPLPADSVRTSDAPKLRRP